MKKEKEKKTMLNFGVNGDNRILERTQSPPNISRPGLRKWYAIGRFLEAGSTVNEKRWRSNFIAVQRFKSGSKFKGVGKSNCFSRSVSSITAEEELLHNYVGTALSATVTETYTSAYQLRRTKSSEFNKVSYFFLPF